MYRNDINLDMPIILFGDEQGRTPFSFRDACNGVSIMGNIGSGKSSSSGRLLALKYLKSGMGGIVLTAKVDEVDAWKEYCRITRRESDLIVVEPGAGHSFNFLEYESNGEKGISHTDNIYQVLKTVISASEEKEGGKSDDQFWSDAMDMFATHIISLCLLAYGKVNVQLLYDIAQSAPRKYAEQPPDGKETAFVKAIKTIQQRITKEIDDWQIKVGPEYVQSLSDDEYQSQMYDAVPDLRELELVDQFFMEGLYSIAEKTRSIIDFCLLGLLYRLLRDPIYSIFCKHPSNFTPEDCIDGKIIVINLPVKKYHKVGRDSQILFKYCFQRAMERRMVFDGTLPVFLWADEAQNFIHPLDADFQATARSSRVATVYISQNLPNYHACMGGDKSKYKVIAFYSTLSTKIFHANNCQDTNELASALIGQAYFEDMSRNVSLSNDFQLSHGTSLKLEHIVRKEMFIGLLTGGPMNDYLTEAYVIMQGSSFSDGTHFRKVTFHQKIYQQ